MITREDIIEYVEETYNGGISTYEYDEFVRVTNGSAVHKADFRLSDSRLEVSAERYGETYNGEHKPTIDGLQTALSKGLGL